MWSQSIVLALAATSAAAPWRLNIPDVKRSVDPGQDKLGGADFPDPTFWVLGSTQEVTLAATGGNGYRIQKATAGNFEDGGYTYGDSELLSEPGAWASGNYWAPDIGQLTDYDQSYYMYYCASNGGPHCLGLARSANTTGIGGPYTDGSDESWICPSDQGGAIDPSGFLDSDNSRYIIYKIDGNYAVGGCNVSTSTAIMVQQLQNDGYTLIGDATNIYDNAGASDEYNIEAPVICKDSGGTYYLFFSSNCYYGPSYTVSYASSSSITGPYENRQALLQTGDYGLTSPGGADVSPDCSQMVFHAYAEDVGGPRSIYAAEISASGGTVTIT